MEIELRDLDEDYASLPEPPAANPPTNFPDTYLGALDKYIFALGEYIRKIQDDEAQVMNQFTKRLQKLKGKNTQKRSDAEEEARTEYANAIEKIRRQRRTFRKMKQDAINERQKLLDSMALQKDDEEMLRQKLFKIKALPDEEALDSSNRAIIDPLAIILGVFQLAMTLIFAFVVEYPAYNYPFAPGVTQKVSDLPTAGLVQGFRGYYLRIDDWYTFYTHIALMVFFGFGFLGSFLKKYGFSSVGFTLLIAVLAFQWTILNNGLWFNVNRAGKHQGSFERIELTFDVIINALYGSTTTIVSLGVLLGRIKPLEIFILFFLEIVFYSLNRYICLLALDAVDTGGGVTIHLFGAYFGLAVSVWLSRPYATSIRSDYQDRAPDEYGSTYTSDLFALMGTIILFVFFPSFNGALAPNGTQYRSVINSILSIIASCIIAFLVSRSFRRRLFDIRDIQNATLAGGVAIASVHNLLIQPGGALLVGAVAGAVSVTAFVWLTPFLERRSSLRIYDTRGVHNVHGIPGLIAGFGGIVAASIIGGSVYNQQSTSFLPRSRPTQGGFQAAMLGISFGIAIASGLVTGALIYFARRATTGINTQWFSDETEWVVPADFERRAELVPVSEPAT